MNKRSDYVFHPPSGSNVPGKIEANPYDFYAPHELRKLINKETDEETLIKMRSSLKKWERIYQYPGYPFREGPPVTASKKLRILAAKLYKLAGLPNPPINLPYYQDVEQPAGYEGIMEVLTNPHDKYDIAPFNYNFQGERPQKDVDFFLGDFTAPKDGAPLDNPVHPDSSGPNPNELEYPFPPTGGDIDGIN